MSGSRPMAVRVGSKGSAGDEPGAGSVGTSGIRPRPGEGG